MSEHPMQAGATEQSPKEFLRVLWGGGGGGGGGLPGPSPGSATAPGGSLFSMLKTQNTLLT